MGFENMNAYKCLKTGGSGQIEEKKSKFIANIRPVVSEEEAQNFIAEMKKQYWDARHNCSAFVIGENAEVTRCSDDGEPSGTAGRPMLEVLLGSEVRNICVVVTRYFGGTLLGTGGLIRAYQSAVKAGLDNCSIILRSEGIRYLVDTDYNGAGKLQYLFGKENVIVEDSIYTDQVQFRIVLLNEQQEHILKQITEITAGSAVVTKEQTTVVDITL